MEPNQVRVGATAVTSGLQQVFHALESRLTRQIGGDIGGVDRRDRIHDDMAVVHPIAPAHLYVRTRPDANSAPDPTAANPFAQLFQELHLSRCREATSGIS